MPSAPSPGLGGSKVAQAAASAGVALGVGATGPNLKWQQTTASVYDPFQGGQNGNPGAGGCTVPVRRIPWSVAHKTLKCGTVIAIQKGSKTVAVPIGDRGPYISGRDLDLRPDVAKRLGLDGLGRVRYAVIPGGAIDLNDFAGKGGNEAAFQQNYAKFLINPGSDPLDPTQAVSDVAGAVGDAASAVPDAINRIGNLIGQLFTKDFWIAAGKVWIGGIALIIGVVMLGSLALNSKSGRQVTGTVATIASKGRV